MKYCSYCGKELRDEAVVCVGCGCPVASQNTQAASKPPVEITTLINTLSERVNINGIIWLVIGVLQILGGIFVNWFLLIVGVVNIITSVRDMQYSKALLETPKGIVARYEPLTGPIITLVYNLVIGGVIGVAGSAYYFFAIRNYVMENKQHFASLDAANN